MNQVKGAYTLTYINKLLCKVWSLGLQGDVPEEESLWGRQSSHFASSFRQHAPCHFQIPAVTVTPSPSQSHTHHTSSASQDPLLRCLGPGSGAPFSSSLNNHTDWASPHSPHSCSMECFLPGSSSVPRALRVRVHGSTCISLCHFCIHTCFASHQAPA